MKPAALFVGGSALLPTKSVFKLSAVKRVKEQDTRCTFDRLLCRHPAGTKSTHIRVGGKNPLPFVTLRFRVLPKSVGRRGLRLPYQAKRGQSSLRRRHKPRACSLDLAALAVESSFGHDAEPH